MAKDYWHWDDAERYPRDDFDGEAEAEEALVEERSLPTLAYHAPLQADKVLSVRVLRNIPKEYGFGAIITSRSASGALVEHTAAFFRDAFYARLKRSKQLWKEAEIEAMNKRKDVDNGDCKES